MNDLVFGDNHRDGARDFVLGDHGIHRGSDAGKNRFAHGGRSDDGGNTQQYENSVGAHRMKLGRIGLNQTRS